MSVNVGQMVPSDPSQYQNCGDNQGGYGQYNPSQHDQGGQQGYGDQQGYGSNYDQQGGYEMTPVHNGQRGGPTAILNKCKKKNDGIQDLKAKRDQLALAQNTPLDSSTGKKDVMEQLTITKMMEKYPKDVVECAMFRKNYKEGRDNTIRKFKELIERGINTETCKRGLENILQKTPAAPPVDPTEPRYLNPDVAWRVRVLKHFHQPDCDNLYELENLNSVLEAYRCGKLSSDGYKHINETGPPFRFDSLKRTSVSVSIQRFNTFQ